MASTLTKVGAFLGGLAGAAAAVFPEVSAFMGIDALEPSSMPTGTEDLSKPLSETVHPGTPESAQVATRDSLQNVAASANVNWFSWQTFRNVLVGGAVGALGGGLLFAGVNWARKAISEALANRGAAAPEPAAA